MNNILEYFEKTVYNYPDKVAISCRDERYTFLELMEASKKLGYLISQSHIQNEPVAVFVNRGLTTVVYFLATLYSGNFYVPIDPTMPAAKTSTILSDCNTKLILYEAENRDLLSNLAFTGAVLTLEDIADSLFLSEDMSNFDISCRALSDAPAYMIYTSGSTGKPKGVLKSHGAVIDFISTYSSHFDLGASEIIGNQTPLFFDASAKDLYLMIYIGATLEILPSELFIFPVTLIEYLNEHGITYVCWVPTALSIVTQLNTFKKVTPTTLKKVFFVGEAFPLKQLNKWLETLPDIQYVNLYGSTEIAGICCYYEIKQNKLALLPMGSALPNCEVFLINDDGFVTEPDIVGELCVVSHSLAIEYYNDPAKTSEVFTALKLPDGSIHRALKTGDLARYDDSGNLIFVSRKDFQIKHMGRRIELGEIEAAADHIPQIQRVCCLYNERKKHICMFCELVEGCDWDGKTIQHHMRDRVSEYMLPSKYYILDALPLNTNGKIDRNGLKAMLK